MNREDILRMGRQAGSFIELAQEKDLLWLERFAALVAKHTLANIDPSSFMTWQEGYEVGKQTEREACAEVCKKHADVYEKLEGNPTAKSAWAACIDNRDAIRARGQVYTTSQQRTWVGLTKEERHEISMANRPYCADVMAAHEEELKRRNT